jgi:hypothetical protein
MLKPLVKGLIVFALLTIFLSGSLFSTKIYAASTLPQPIVSNCAMIANELNHDKQALSNAEAALANASGMSASTRQAYQKLIQSYQADIKKLQAQYNACINSNSNPGHTIGG